MPLSLSSLLGSVGLGSAAPALETAGVDLSAAAPEALAAFAIGSTLYQVATGKSVIGTAEKALHINPPFSSTKGKGKKSSRRRSKHARRHTTRKRR